jgi:signal recognition particle receptor subunit alpha
LSGNDLRVLIAGCDTFRAGAIEQLLTHVRHLNNIFNEKNMSMIDVVLIDTAGRMQNDEPLMIALAKVINYSFFFLKYFYF